MLGVEIWIRNFETSKEGDSEKSPRPSEVLNREGVVPDPFVSDYPDVS